MSIYYAWLLATLFSAFLGWGGFHFVQGFTKYAPGYDDAGPISYGIGGAVVGAIFFFLFLLVTGAPVSNLDHYHVAGMSVLMLGFGVPLLAPIVAALVELVCLAVSLAFARLQLGLHNLGAKTRVVVDSANEYRAAVARLRHEEARIRALEHQPDLGDLGDAGRVDP